MTNDERRASTGEADRSVLLLLGKAERSEFREARTCLERWGAVRAMERVGGATTALAGGQVAPELIVVAQSRPGEFSHEAIDELRRAAPLTRIVRLMGSWCEGEMRSGSPWPATARVYWHQWPARCDQQFSRLRSGRPCCWALPVTATEEERLLADVAMQGTEVVVGKERSGRGDSRRQQRSCPADLRRVNNLPCDKIDGGLVAIRSRSSEMANWLLAACRSRGLAGVWQRRSGDVQIDGATAAIFDAGELNEGECGELARFAMALRPCPVIALLAFPRIEDHERALAAGAAAVLSKPVALEDLFWQIEGLRGAGTSAV